MMAPTPAMLLLASPGMASAPFDLVWRNRRKRQEPARGQAQGRVAVNRTGAAPVSARVPAWARAEYKCVAARAPALVVAESKSATGRRRLAGRCRSAAARPQVSVVAENKSAVA